LKKFVVAFALAFAVIAGAVTVSIATGTAAVAEDRCKKSQTGDLWLLGAKVTCPTSAAGSGW
jgi:hypothetical protein